MNEYEGFLLSYVKYGDYDAILHVFTKSEGYKSFFLRGIYSKNNRKKALLQPLLCVRFNVNATSKGLARLTDLQLTKPQENLGVKMSTIIFFVAEFLNQVLRDETVESEIYSEIEEFKNQLEQGNFSAHVQFLVRLVKIFGVTPLKNDGRFLNPQKGVFENVETHHLFDEENSAVWRNLLENSYSVSLDNKFRKSILDGLMVYYQIHFPNFRVPMSLPILQQIWA